MSFGGDNDVVDSVLYSVSGTAVTVVNNQSIDLSQQPTFILSGLSGSIVKPFSLDTTGKTLITGTVSLERGVSSLFPLFVSGTINAVTPINAYGGQIEGRSSNGSPTVGNPLLISGEDGSTTRTILVDSLGRIITAPAGSSTSVTSSLATGYVQTAALTRVAVRATSYNEQTTNAQRSISSNNANDSALGTGARTVQIEYYDQNYSGPYYEIVTLNGTTPVNLTNSNVCFIEEILVLTAGSTGNNIGVITLHVNIAGSGGVITTIAAGDNKTFFAHHYVSKDNSSYITGLSVGHNGTTAGSGCLFEVRARNSGSTVFNQVSDFVRLYGQSSTITRNWGTPILVKSSSLITVFATPETSTSTRYRSAIDLYDQ